LRKGKTNYRVNKQIRAERVRVIGSDGKQLGVMSLTEALAESKKEGFDLIEIAPKAKPPVTKIADIGKFRYQQEKKRKKQKSKSKSAELKEVRFSPFIGDHDYIVRTGRIKEFLDEGNKVRATVVFKGRQMGSKKFGYDLLKKVLGEFEERVVVDMNPKFVGRHLQMVISPVKRGMKQENTNK
jgi:translation initiation factor IF-3